MKAWTKGDRVVQPPWARTLVEVNEHHTVIDFDEHGRRAYLRRGLSCSGHQQPAPAKAARKRAAGEAEEAKA
jgi:hypothetical protein